MITWEYLAGFIDGEGSIKCYDSRPRLTIGQKNKEVLEAIQEFLATTWPYTSGKTKLTYSRGCWYLQLNAVGVVVHVIRGVLPHLIVKKEDALHALEVAERPRIARMIDGPEADKFNNYDPAGRQI